MAIPAAQPVPVINAPVNTPAVPVGSISTPTAITPQAIPVIPVPGA